MNKKLSYFRILSYFTLFVMILFRLTWIEINPYFIKKNPEFEKIVQDIQAARKNLNQKNGLPLVQSKVLSIFFSNSDFSNYLRSPQRLNKIFLYISMFFLSLVVLRFSKSWLAVFAINMIWLSRGVTIAAIFLPGSHFFMLAIISLWLFTLMENNRVQSRVLYLFILLLNCLIFVVDESLFWLPLFIVFKSKNNWRYLFFLQSMVFLGVAPWARWNSNALTMALSSLSHLSINYRIFDLLWIICLVFSAIYGVMHHKIKSGKSFLTAFIFLLCSLSLALTSLSLQTSPLNNYESLLSFTQRTDALIITNGVLALHYFFKLTISGKG